MKYLMVIDQGTSSTRCIIFDQQLQVLAVAQQAFASYFPHPGWVEQNAEEIWDSVLATIRQALQSSGLSLQQISGLGITNQRETTLLWDKKTGKAVAPAIVWQDRRTEMLCQDWAQRDLGALIQEKTGLVIDPYFSASKLVWLFEKDPALRQRAKRGELLFGTVDSFLLWRLTQGKQHLTDISNASRTLLFNIHSQTWDQDLLQLFDIPEQILPKVIDNFGDLAVAEILGETVPITGMAGDQQAALIGQGCIHEGELKITYGTGGFLLLNTGKSAVASKEHLLTTIAYRAAKELVYALEASIFSVGTVVQWLRDELGVIKNSSDSDQMAASLPDNQGVFCIPAFTGLGAPHWRPDSRAAFYGIGRETSKAHFVRAALEAIVYQTKEVIDAMQQDAHQKIEKIYLDGGVSKNNWLLQFLADITQLKIYRPENIEATATGAAVLVGMGAGIWDDFAQTILTERKMDLFQPKMSAAEADMKYQEWRRYLEHHLTAGTLSKNCES